MFCASCFARTYPTGIVALCNHFKIPRNAKAPDKDQQFSYFSSVLTLSLPESVTETFKVIVTCESEDEILLCDHSNNSSSAVLSHGALYFVFCKMKFGIRLEF